MQSAVSELGQPSSSVHQTDKLVHYHVPGAAKPDHDEQTEVSVSQFITEFSISANGTLFFTILHDGAVCCNKLYTVFTLGKH